MAKTKHWDELTKRGFVRVTKHAAFDMFIKKYGRRGGPTSFTQSVTLPLMTFATDETHYTWIASGHVDLTDLGFVKNDNSILHEVLKRRSTMH